jgi:prepilin peptidase CpaA
MRRDFITSCNSLFLKTMEQDFSMFIFWGDALRWSVLFIALIITAYMDLAHRKISDRVTLGGSVVGIFLLTFTQGHYGLISSCLGWGLGFLPFYLLFRMGGLGLGDVKLMGMVGALGGFGFVCQSFWYTGLIGFFMALYVLIQKGQIRSGMKRVLFLCLTCVGIKNKNPEPQDPLETLTIPYGLAIVLGSYWAFFKGLGW